jgi:hypothetical protein
VYAEGKSVFQSVLQQQQQQLQQQQQQTATKTTKALIKVVTIIHPDFQGVLSLSLRDFPIGLTEIGAAALEPRWPATADVHVQTFNCPHFDKRSKPVAKTSHVCAFHRSGLVCMSQVFLI